MQTAMKIVISLIIILTCTTLAKKYPTLAGFIAVMPLTSVLVMVWVHLENQGNSQIMTDFLRGVCWGFIPSLLFYLAALFLVKKQMPLPAVLALSFSIWTTATLLHQYILHK